MKTWRVALPMVLLLGSPPAWAQDAGTASDAGIATDAASLIDEAALGAALQADRGARNAPGTPAPASAAAPGNGPVPADLDAQARVRPPGTGLLNPNLSVILDATFGYYGIHHSDFTRLGLPPSGDDPSPDREGFNLQEIEFAFQAPIDPYLEGSVFLTIPNLEGVEVEEAYLLTTSLPANLQVKAGSFRSQVGRNNGQHLHSQNFTRRPLMTPLLFGADGFRGPGVQASVLLPGLPWYATLYGEAFSVEGPEDGSVSTFGGGGRSPKHLTFTAVLEQFWSLTDATSLMLGLNFATGQASDCGTPPCVFPHRSYLYGGDLYVKWRPTTVVGERISISLTAEYFARTLGEGGPTEGAGYAEPLVQLARRWYLGGRFDIVGLPTGPNLPRRYGAAASITFAPTEFSRLRLYGQDLWAPGVPQALVGFVQAEYSMGAHGAHAF